MSIYQSPTLQGVTPSGVAFEVSELLTEDQNNLVKNAGGDKGHWAFADLVYARLERLGSASKPNINQGLVRKILDADLRFILISLRNLSFQDEKRFKFKVDFPVEAGENSKISEEREIDMTTFEYRPYAWVCEKIKEDAVNAGIEEDAVNYSDPAKWPVMYESYEAMLKANLTQTYKTPKGEIKYDMLNGGSPQPKKGQPSRGPILESLYMRNAKSPVKTEGDTAWQAVMWERVPARLQEDFRSTFMRVEGFIDTTVTIRSVKAPAKSVTVNFMALGEFFSPSLATQ